MEKTEKALKRVAVAEVAKAVIIALIVCLLLVLGAALLTKFANLSDNIITPIIQGIKIVSVLIGCLVAFRSKSDGWIKGILTGIIFVGLAFVLFSILDGEWNFSWTLLNDVAFSAAAGLISGIISVNMRKK